MAAVKSDQLKVKNGEGNLKVVASLDANSVDTIFTAGELLPAHFISEISGTAGKSLNHISGAVAPRDPVGGYAPPVNVMAVTGTVKLDGTSDINVQTTAEMAATVVSDVIALTTGAQQVVKVAVANSKAELDKSLTLIVHNGSPNVAYIKLHDNSLTVPSAPGLASATDYTYRLDSYATYEAIGANARLWHSVSGAIDVSGKLVTTVTKQ